MAKEEVKAEKKAAKIEVKEKYVNSEVIVYHASGKIYRLDDCNAEQLAELYNDKNWEFLFNI